VRRSSRHASPRAEIGFGFVLLAMVLAISDYTIADAVIPALAEDLDLSVTQLGLGFTAYFATAAAFLVLFGRLGDVIGRRRIMVLGVTFFAAGSTVSGLAWDLASFCTGRVLAGLALAAILPTGLGVLHALFPSAGRARERAFAWWAMAIGAAAVVGPLVGGLAASMAHWRWAFLAAMPLGVVAAVGVRGTVVENQRRSLAGVDAAGALLLAVAAGSLALAVDLGGAGRRPFAAILLAVGIVVAAAFFGVSRRRVRRSREVIAPPRLFGYRSFRSATFSSAFMSVGDTGFQLVLPLMAGVVIGTSQLGIGVLLACYGAGAMVGGPAAAGLNRYIDDRRAAILALLALPVLLLALLPLLSKGASIVGIGALLAAYGVAWSIAYARLVNLSYQEVPEPDSAVAGGIQSAMRLFAGALGAAILTAVFGGVAAGHVAKDASSVSLHAVPSHQRLQMSPNQQARQPIPTESEIADAYSAGARAAIVTAAGITALALVFALRIPAVNSAAVRS
jgi:MFS family permease